MAANLGADAYRTRALADLKTKIPFDAHVWATGRRTGDGTIKIDKPSDPGSPEGPHVEGLAKDDFLGQYEDLAAADVVGMLFTAFPRTVHRISREDYLGKLGGRAGREMAEYLDVYKVNHLLLAGLESRRFGIAWVTLYRLDERAVLSAKAAFTDDEVERAGFLVPHLLHEWLLVRYHDRPSLALRVGKGDSAVGDEYGLLGLTPTEVFVASFYARGFSAKEIAKKIGRADQTVEMHRKNIRKKLGAHHDALMARILGRSHPDRAKASNVGQRRPRSKPRP